ncbi:MAG TPA: DUF2232 domain-containing protein [Thermoanaerobaculia bacterium]
MIDTTIPQSEQVDLPGQPNGKLARSLAGYSLLTALMIITPMLVFVPAALLHCGIRNGRRAAWVVLGGAIALAAIYVAVVPAADTRAALMAWSYIAGIALAVAVPTIAALPLVERAEPFGRVVMFLLMGSIAGLVATELGSRAVFSFSPYEAQVVQAQQTSAQFVEVYRSRGLSSEMVAFAERWIGFSTFVLPGVILVNMSLVFILSLLMLGRLKLWRELAAARGDQSAGTYLFRNFSLPDWLLFAFVIGGLTPLVSGMLQKVAANTLAIVVFLYLLQGLAIFRFVLIAMGAGFAGTMLGWLLLGFLMITGVGPLLLTAAGLFDSFFDFRHFKKRKDDSHEGHTD